MKQPSRYRIVGQSQGTCSLRKALMRVARHSGGVLLSGERGVGKELGARTIHRESSRRRGPFRVVDCARFFPEDLTAILFGSEDRPGTALLSRADRGTLYLAHPEETALSIQERLLEFMKSGAFTVGREGPSRQASVRLVTGSEKDLDVYVRGGLLLREFSEILASDTVAVPPLRERREDVPAIIEHYLGGAVSDRFAPGVLSVFERYPWPGNYDELIEEVERLIRTGYARIEVAHVRRDIVSFEATPVSADPDILHVLEEIEQCIAAFQISDGATLDFAPYFWRGGPVPDGASDQFDSDCDFDYDPWEKDLAW